MIAIDATTKSIRVTTGSSGNVDVFVGYGDKQIQSRNAFVTSGMQAANITTATTTTVLSAPTSANIREVKTILATNKAATSNVLTFVVDISGTTYQLAPAVTVGAGEALCYHETLGWYVLDAGGRTKERTLIAGQVSSVLMPIFASTAALTGTKTITSTNTFAVYVGKAPRALTSVQLRCRVTTAMATITWGEVGLAKGSINVGGNPTLTPVGYADVSATYNSTGQKTTTINVSSGQVVNEGDDLWALIGNAATTALVVRSLNMADDIQIGILASAVTRPSTTIGTGVAYTIESATAQPAWVAII